jgi:transcription termination factor NusB
LCGVFGIIKYKRGNEVVSKNDDTKKCFYITPIGEKSSVQYSKLEGLKENVLKPVLKSIGYELEVAHTIDSPGSINDQIFERIVNSELVIVNLTGLNPNVMYELAVRHSFGKPCVMICESDTKLPFDLLEDRTIFFEDTIKGSGELKVDLENKIKSALENGNDNPVTRAVAKTAILEGSSTENEPLKLILSELVLLGNRLDNLESRNNSDYLIFGNKYQDFIDKSDPIGIKKFSQVYNMLSNDLKRPASPAEIAAELDISTALSEKMYKSIKKNGLL